MKCSNVSRSEFIAAISDAREDKFAHTFVGKADMYKLWEHCIGVWEDKELLGALIFTTSKQLPKRANLQLLHTFFKHRGKGVGRKLCEVSLRMARADGCEYFRISSEPDAVKFYEAIGVKFYGKQKSGTSLSILKTTANDFKSCEYDLNDAYISKAIDGKARGGLVDLYK